MGERKPLLKRMRNKLVLLLLVYFAGYATAVYHLVPAPDEAYNKRNFAYSEIQSGEFVTSFSKTLHQCVDFSKLAALHTAEMIKQAYNQRKTQIAS